MYKLQVAVNIDIGRKRERNEDAIGYRFPDTWQSYQDYGALFVVADGVGSLKHSELASERLVHLLLERYYQSVPRPNHPVSLLNDVIVKINEEIFQVYQEEKGATTLVAVLIHHQKVIVAHVGDSRMYGNLRQSGWALYTQDHTQEITDRKGRKKHKLTQAVGHRNNVEVTFTQYPIQQGDRILLCSDGLSRYINQQMMQRIHNESKTQRDFVRNLVNHALDSGGADNISVIDILVDEQITGEKSFVAYQKSLVNGSAFVDLKENVSTTKDQTMLDETKISSKPFHRGYLFIVAVVLMMLGAMAFVWMQSQPSPPAIIQVTVLPTITPTVTVTPVETEVPPPTIESHPPTKEIIITVTPEPQVLTFIFAETAPTLTRINGTVISFVIEINSVYVVAEEYRDSQDQLWYRLYDARNIQYGWIQETNLPSYRLGNDT